MLTENGGVYMLSMYHQLHCLGVLREHYWRLLDGALDNDASVIEEADNKRHHTGHCFDYLRQSVECSADMTLEWPRTEEDGRRFKTDGWGVPHVCTNKVSTMSHCPTKYR